MNVYHYVDMTRANADGTFPVYVVVKNNAGRFFANTGLTASEKLAGLTFPKRDANARQKTTLLCKYLADVERVCLQSEVAGLTNKELKNKIRLEVFGIEPKKTVLALADLIADYAKGKKERTKDIYLRTHDKVLAFDAKVGVDDVSRQWLGKFREYLLGRGLKTNTIAIELRNIRSAINWAISEGRTTNYPFRGFVIEHEEKAPNNIGVEQLRMLRDYPCEEWQKRYRDFFMLSFYLAGINPVDLLHMRADAVQNGHIAFVRQKTNKQGQKKMQGITLPVVDEARAIIDRYPSKEGWLLGFMDGRADYRTFTMKCNRALKMIGDKETQSDVVGRGRRKVVYHPILPKITMYTARYTFGSIAANDLDISERTIGQCLGHSWAKNVTCRYMANDQRKVDAAVRRVVDYVNSDEVADY